MQNTVCKTCLTTKLQPQLQATDKNFVERYNLSSKTFVQIHPFLKHKQQILRKNKGHFIKKTTTTEFVRKPLLESQDVPIAFMPIRVMREVLFKHIICCQYNVSIDKLTNIYYKCIWKRCISYAFIHISF
jgi:hypothetical protein